jgi:hypothetical protein
VGCVVAEILSAEHFKSLIEGNQRISEEKLFKSISRLHYHFYLSGTCFCAGSPLAHILLPRIPQDAMHQVFTSILPRNSPKTDKFHMNRNTISFDYGSFNFTELYHNIMAG